MNSRISRVESDCCPSTNVHERLLIRETGYRPPFSLYFIVFSFKSYNSFIHSVISQAMWAYLFWTVVVAWLFTLRPKRDIDEDDRVNAQPRPRPSSNLGNGFQQGHCAHTCCHVHAHAHINGQGQSRGMEPATSPVVSRPNANLEFMTPARTELSWADQSYGTLSERDVSRLFPFQPGWLIV
jgi:hypothetical protein